MAKPVVGYVGAVLGVIAIASLAVFSLEGMAAKAHRHWDADIDRIVAYQQAKKRSMVAKRGMVALARAEMQGVESDAGPQIAALTREPIEDEDEVTASKDESSAQKFQSQSGKKNNRRSDRRQRHYIPAAFATLPKFATTTAAATTTLLQLR